MTILIPRRRWLRKPEGVRLRLNNSHPLAANLIGAWLFNELAGPTVWDYGSGENHGTITGSSISRIRGRFGSCLSFTGDGTTDRVDLGSIASGNPLMLDNQELTIISRVLYDEAAKGNLFPRLIDKSDGGSAANGWTFFVAEDVNRWRWQVDGGNIDFTPRIVQVWSHPAIIRSAAGNFTRFYSDVGTGRDGSNTAGTTIPTATTNAAIGNWNHATDREWPGLIEHLFVFDRALNYAEIDYVRRAPYALFVPARDITYSIGFAPGEAGTVVKNQRSARISAVIST